MSTLKTKEELVAEIQKGIDVEENKVQLFTQSRGILVFFAKMYMRDVMDEDELQDYIYEGYFAIEKSCMQYDPAKGSFMSFLRYNLHECFKNYNRYGRLIGIPINIANDSRKYYRAKEQLEENGIPSNDKEIMKAANLKKWVVDCIKEAHTATKISSLDSPLDDPHYSDGNAEKTLKDTISDGYNLEESIISPKVDEDMPEVWEETRNIIGERNTEIMLLLFRDGVNVTQAAEIVGLSHPRVSRIKKASLEKLRNSKLLKRLYDAKYDLAK